MLKKASKVAIAATLCLTIGAVAQPQKPETGFAIQNVQTGKNLRPYEAGGQSGNKIVLYDAIEWKCMTWKMNKVEGETYQLRNILTKKSIEPSAAPKAGVSLFQQPLKDDALQQWDFLKQGDENYRIRLKGTELFVTISSDQTNSDIVLQPKQDSKGQEWKLVEQSPTM